MSIGNQHENRSPMYEMVLHDSATNTRAFLVVDSLRQGLGAGGIRLTPTVSLKEVRRLARAMTHKFSAMNVPLGGAKAGIVAGSNGADRQTQLEAFARMAQPFLSSLYIAGEDMGTTATDVSSIYKIAGTSWVDVAASKINGFNLPPDFDPTNFHGVNLEEQFTGFGVAAACEEACRVVGLDPRDSSVAIQGFGTVGSVTANNLFEKGFKITTIADVKGTIHCDNGLDIAALIASKDELGTINRNGLNPDYEQHHRDTWLLQGADILVPAALADTINAQNVDRVQAKLIVEAANIPITLEAEHTLHARGVHIVPDFIANAGAAGGFGLMITAQVEMQTDAVFTELERRMRRATSDVLSASLRDCVTPRSVAEQLAESRFSS